MLACRDGEENITEILEFHQWFSPTSCLGLSSRQKHVPPTQFLEILKCRKKFLKYSDVFCNINQGEFAINSMLKIQEERQIGDLIFSNRVYALIRGNGTLPPIEVDPDYGLTMRFGRKR